MYVAKKATKMVVQYCISNSNAYDIFINYSWVVTRWQYTFTHKQYREQHK